MQNSFIYFRSLKGSQIGKKLSLLISFTLITICLKAQQLQIARVNTAGATKIYTDLKTALAAAQDDDFIYLPGETFIVDSLNFRKRINVIGTGHYPDSTVATGKTIITTTCYIFNGGNNGSLQGVEINGNINAVEECNFSFLKLKVAQITIPALAANNGGIYNITDCILLNSISGFGVGNNLSANFNRCICLAEIGSCRNSTYRNNIFLYAITNGYMGWQMYNNQFYNNIFNANGLISFQNGSNNQFYNNHVINTGAFGGFGNSSIEINTTTEIDLATTFVNVPDNSFNYNYNYRINPASSAYNSGSDNTQKGIYGSNAPYNPNPYNPHIYFKNIAATTNAQGQLQIELKANTQ